ncbi:MAG: SDR family oxidoreductase [Lachnospiraceae bacterium]
MLAGKVCVVTNGAKGIGRKIIEEYAREGCTIAYIDTDEVSGKRFRNFLWTDYGVDAFFFHGDICSDQDIEIFTGGIIGQYGKVDYLIHNTCVNQNSFKSQKNNKDEVFREAVGSTALHELLHAFEGYWGPAASAVSIIRAEDADVRVMTQILAKQYAGTVRVNSVNPSPDKIGIQTKYVTALDVSQTIFFLGDERADFINGENLEADGSILRMKLCKNANGWSYIEGLL